MNLFNLFCKIDVNSFPKQLVKVILETSYHLSFVNWFYDTNMFNSIGKVPLSIISLNILSREDMR